MGCEHKYLKRSEEQDLFKGTATKKKNILTLSHHEASYLTELLVKNASHRISELTGIQREAQSLGGERKYDISVFTKKLSKLDPKSKSYLDLAREFTTDYMTIYDKLFFFGSFLATRRMSYIVERRPESTKKESTKKESTKESTKKSTKESTKESTKKSTKESTKKSTKERTKKESTDGMAAFTAYKSDGQGIHTSIHLFIETVPITTLEEEVMDWLGSLVHEMLHAFYFIFGCFYCYSLPVQLGKGHGHAWQDAAYAIEIALLELLSTDVHLSRVHSFSWDVEHGETWPEDSFLENWDMIGPNPERQLPEPPKRAEEKDDVAKRSSELPSAEKQLPHRPKEELGGDNNKCEGTGKSGQHKPPSNDDRDKRRKPPKSSESENREKRIPIESGERKGKGEKSKPSSSDVKNGKEREKSKPSSSDVKSGKEREKREPPGNGEHEKRDSSRKGSKIERNEPSRNDDKSKKRDLHKNGMNDSRSSSLETQTGNRIPR